LPRSSIFRASLTLVFLLAGIAARSQQESEVLTNAADVISLSAERASLSLKVSVTGVVTAADPTLKGRFFMQDGTGGVFVDNFDGQRLDAGDVVEVTGISHPGAYAPIITAPQVRKIGTAPLPPARPVTIERLMSGAEDSQRIEISGLVRNARVDGLRLAVELASGGYRFRVYCPVPPGKDPQTLVAAQVRVRGTAAEAHNRTLRQLIAPELYVPDLDDFVVEKAEMINPFDESVINVNSLMQYRRDNHISQRIHVRGVVTLQRLGDNLFLQDASGGLQVRSRQLDVFAPGDVVEAAGFPGIENFLPVLEDAILRKVELPPEPVKPTLASVEQIQSGLHHAGFISIKGRVMDRTVRQVRRQQAAPMVARTTFVLQNSNSLFIAEADDALGTAELSSIPVGSFIEVSGVCLTEIDADGVVKAFRMLVGNRNDVRILEEPAWWTPQRLLIGLASVCAVLILAVSWTVMVSKRNSALKVLIGEKEHARIELQQAHDELEDRVKERTAQLKLQITARKEAQLKFQAVLTERTRLAQELHDTLEQTLTGIALQMDTAAKVMAREPAAANRHFELARDLVAQGQTEVRRSVWDLRSRALEHFDLPSALRESSKQLTEGTSIQVEVTAKGRVRPLPETIEDNLLRIALESLTNVLKHSGATAATIQLDYSPCNIFLQVEDNGKGFAVESCAGPRDGHFGLLGIKERAKRLGGQASVASTDGQGTLVRVQIPIEPAQEVPFIQAADAEAS
jgi:signal transduction histidine kinase